MLSIFSDGDGRILVGESVLTSIVYKRAPLFIQVVQRVVNNNWTRIDYGAGLGGGYSDDAVGLASFGGAFYDSPGVRFEAEQLLNQEIALLRNRVSNGLCGVSAIGLTPANGSDCLSPTDLYGWRYNLSQMPPLANITYLGTSVVPLVEVYARYSDGVVVTFVALSACLLLILVALAAYGALAVYRHELWIKYASPPFMFMILAGAALVCVSVVLSNNPSTGHCTTALCLFVVGLNFMQGSVLVKGGRIWFYLRRVKKMKRVQLPQRTLFIAITIQTLIVGVRPRCSYGAKLTHRSRRLFCRLESL